MEYKVLNKKDNPNRKKTLQKDLDAYSKYLDTVNSQINDILRILEYKKSKKLTPDPNDTSSI